MLTMEQRTQVSDDLALAAIELWTRGWCQRSTVDEEGHVCVIGALRAVITGGDPDTHFTSVEQSARFHLARNWLQQNLGRPPTSWNDVPGRTQPEVFNALVRASNAVTVLR